MNTIKSAALLIVLVGVLYGVYVALSKPDIVDHAHPAGGDSGPPLIEWGSQGSGGPSSASYTAAGDRQPVATVANQLRRQRRTEPRAQSHAAADERYRAGDGVEHQQLRPRPEHLRITSDVARWRFCRKRFVQSVAVVRNSGRLACEQRRRLRRRRSPRTTCAATWPKPSSSSPETGTNPLWPS